MKTSKKKLLMTVIPLTVVVIGLAIAAIVVLQNNDNKPKENQGNQTEIKEVVKKTHTIEVYSEVPTIEDYLEEGIEYDPENDSLEFEDLKTEETNCGEEETNCISTPVVTEIGTYKGKVTFSKKDYEVTLEVVDTKAPELTVEEVTITEGETYTAESFVKDKTDNSKKEVEVKFEKDEMGEHKEVGTYTTTIVATDSSKNTTTQTTKLTITKKEESKTTSSSSTTSKTQTTKPSSSSTSKPSSGTTTPSTQKPSTSTGTTQTPTTQAPATQPASDDLYYNIYHPNGIKNPKLTGKSEAEHNSIYNSGGIVNPNNGDIHKVVSSFDAQIGGSYTVAYVDEYYDKSQSTFKGYYAEGRVYVKSTVSLMVPDPTNPYYNSLTYKEDGNGRLVGTWYYTNASGSKQWLWNPNNLHF